MNLTLTFSGTINDDFISNLTGTIYKHQSKIDSFLLQMSSPGGGLVQGITAYNFLKRLPFPVFTHNIGEVSSAAILPYLAGIRRTAESNSKFMFHPVTISVSGDLPFFKVEEVLKNISQDIQNYAAIVEKECAILSSQHDIQGLLKHDSLVFSALDAYSVGITTEIIT